MKTRNAEILLALVIVARATSFVMSKTLLNQMEPLNTLALRFLLAFLIMVLLFRKHIKHIKKEDFLSGFVIGSTFFVVMVMEMLALQYTDSSKVAFLENTAIVFVPLMNAALLRHMPSWQTLGCTLLALAGIGFLTLGGGFQSLGLGEVLGILSGITYAIAILATSRFSQGRDGLNIGIVQLGTMGILSLVSSLVLETPHLPTTSESWIMMLLLAIVCSCFGFTLQPVAQKHVSPEKAGMLCALSPLAAAVLGMVLLGEALGVTGCIGGAAILGGILLETWLENQHRPQSCAQ